MELSKATSVNSRAEELFVQLFCEAFGPEKTENLQVQSRMEKSSRIFLSRLATSGCSTISARKVSETLPSSTAGISSRRRIWQISS